MPNICEAFLLAAELADARGATPLNKHKACWEAKVDDNWWLAINAHREPTPCRGGAEVPPGHVYVEWNGWPAGFINAYGGSMAAGEAANEDTLCTALRAAAKAAT